MTPTVWTNGREGQPEEDVEFIYLAYKSGDRRKTLIVAPVHDSHPDTSVLLRSLMHYAKGKGNKFKWWWAPLDSPTHLPGEDPPEET